MASITDLSICQTDGNYFLNYELHLDQYEEFVAQSASDYIDGLASKAGVMYKAVSEGGGGVQTLSLALGSAASSEGRVLQVALKLQGGSVKQREEKDYSDEDC